MTIVITMLHIIVSIFMIAVVLLQSGKGAEMGASFGSSGSQSVFGAGGGTTFLSKMTTGAAVIFMLTSMTLAHLSGQPASSSIMKGASRPAAAVPAQQAPAAPMQGKPAAMPAAPSAPAAPAVPAAPAAPVQPKK